MKKLMNILKSEKGQGMVEYALILALVSIVAITLLTSVGSAIKNQLSQVVAAL